ncbi:maleylpyruvate isomerase family mycothiol-dependent enzyme [Nonomuraea dietziae]|uniref:maleylpyruvate isomerase family mycothiol-dependent enzyme n=1 Tax=Nonomuraea dietziae TaxID=65515 RepID=UPI0034362529
MNETWAVVHAEREALIRDLETVPPERWTTPSLCPGWDVHDVVAHLADDAKTTRLSFLLRLAAARFDFDRYNNAGVVRERAGEPRRTLASFRAASRRTTGAPAPRATRLVEAFVHGEDIRRPLGLSRDYPVKHVAAALRYQLSAGVALGGGKERARGVRLMASDTAVDVGEGPEVRGTALALLLAASGRPVGPDELTGPGVPALTRDGGLHHG